MLSFLDYFYANLNMNLILVVFAFMIAYIFVLIMERYFNVVLKNPIGRIPKINNPVGKIPRPKKGFWRF